MNRFLASLIFIAVALPVSGKTDSEIGHSASLSKSADKVVEYLLKDWRKRFHSTTIPHAMDILGIKSDENLRLEVVEHFRKNRKLARNLRSWSANNYLFTNTEKRIAKLLLNAERDGIDLPSPADAAETIGISEDEMKNRLSFMARAGFLEKYDKSDLGYRLADGARRWGGALRHNFHTIMVEGEDKYDVW